MKLAEARDLAWEYIMLYNLDILGWVFRFNKRKHHVGLCRYHVKHIELSAYWVHVMGVVDVIDTIKHEIAHALVGRGHGHDEVWKAKARELGATPKACLAYTAQIDMSIGAKYRAECACGSVHFKYRKPRRTLYCRKVGLEKGILKFVPIPK